MDNHRDGSPSDRIVQLMTQAPPVERDRAPRIAMTVRDLAAGAVLAAGDVHITWAPPDRRGAFAESPPVDRALLIDLIELCGNQFGDRRYYLPHMLLRYGAARIERLTDAELQELAAWCHRRATGRAAPKREDGGCQA